MSKDILSCDKIYEMTFNLRVKESLFFRQKIKELYCPDFECEIESFCVILPSKYKKEFTKSQLLSFSNWLFFTEFSDEAYAFKRNPQHWSSDAEDILS